ncbi:DUF981 domain-containing protein [Deinococcus radiodurans]|jgi:Protein of unknown function (DUF981).|uniref:DUF981 domain-containing protein n=1 Tax=Deinococcus radiodurans TaxID=1299 RepID=UPI000485CA30|nr:DUF981 domain-containing protein [Deinococcus radiodurans]ANC71469.1 hypothetical protein A2G07_06635 [Deinococcus radiodurans R1 = ATCC 13939 = DSM 20539]QEM70843.1 DUF981 domain-containing protein [Deinococcus radiodurans]QIP29413.1 DUF981 domain-containing protein [Deinococcus radiodurans]QIP31895.1 DUF981 domain-containing protein [Deinococcus radiodurans]UDL00495.1 DUF981 domain-containing protein [Deinococcus radiodurans R1 = ATCC 13939 = DSM 20539]
MSTSGGLIIDWTQMHTYNTVMAVAAGAGLLSVVALARQTVRGEPFVPEAWAVNFGILGTLMTLTGAHMTLTWPLAKYFPFDNIIFGEPSLAFGVLLLGTAAYLWRRAEHLRSSPDLLAEMVAFLRPLQFLLVGLGLSLLGIAAAGVAFRLFAAPPEEPISGRFATMPWLEASAISGLYALVGLTALLIPLALRQDPHRLAQSGLVRAAGWRVGLSGLVWLLFGALNYFTHIGLIINTTAK